MSRNEGKIRDERVSPVDASDILAALAKETGASGKRRQDAISRYLSASEGWREASAVLGGAFAAGDEALKSAKDV